VADGEEVARLVQERFPEAVTGAGHYGGQHWIEMKADRLVEVCRFLRDDGAARFDFLVDVTAVHWPGESRPVEAVYHLYSYARNDRLRLKVRAANGDPLPSVSGVWKAAEWNEREAYDMFGLRFTGHPDLRRILMPDDYTDFPLRKEFPLYRG
jgi:NADH-quinone oxidoreductase subunit C